MCSVYLMDVDNSLGLQEQQSKRSFADDGSEIQTHGS